MPRRKKIFLSYRRGDTAGHVGRLYDDLVRVFGEDRVFMDVGGLTPGDNFIDVLRQGLAEAAVVVVAIGPRWAGTTDDGRRRIDDFNDFVRLEVATALADTKTRVIPVLCEGARLPDERTLPDTLAPLTRRQAFELSDSRWRQDVMTLFTAIAPFVPYKDRNKRVLQRVGMAIAALLVLAAGGTWAVRTVQAKLAESSARESNSRDDSREREAQRASAKRDAQRDSRMPSAPPPRVLPAHVVATASEQLSRARREWVDDAAVTSIDIDCTSGREGECPLRLRLSSASRVASMDATQQAPDSAWHYRQRGGASRTAPLSLEIVEFERIVAAARAIGVTSDFDRVQLASVELQNGTSAPRWTLWPRNREQAGREGRLCFEPQSATKVDCRTGQ